MTGILTVFIKNTVLYTKCIYKFLSKTSMYTPLSMNDYSDNDNKLNERQGRARIGIFYDASVC